MSDDTEYDDLQPEEPRPPKRRMPYIKMCGFINAKEAKTAALLGADLIGLNFWPGSPRAIHFRLAEQIQQAAREGGAERGSKRPVRTVAVVVDPEPELIFEILREVKPDIIQFHGDEPVHVCRYFSHPFIKAFRLRGEGDISKIKTYAGGYSVGFLLDGAPAGEYGGTGKQVSTALATLAFREPRGFLAGGLNPANVGNLVRQLQPYGVDVASGIERDGRPGYKSVDLMAEFIREVRAAVENPFGL
jgi:phosphoribosylanthranilate isomerase